jgi:cell pole-organizing protein PopZ
MSDAKGQHEPSMEEILASIRRIIAEDNDAPVTADDPPAQDAKTAAEIAPPSQPAAAPAAPAPAPSPTPVVAAAKEDDVLELTEVVEEEPSVTPPTPEPVIFEKHPEEPVMSVEADLPETQTASSATAERDRLLSNTTAAASVAALSQLVVRPRDKAGELPMGNVDRTLEDMVRELLRPMLKDWLDEHLPKLVERIVKDEVGRLVREAQGS